MENKIAFTLDHLVSECGYKINHNRGKTNDKFKAALQFFIDNNVIVYKQDIFSLKPSQYFKVDLPEKSIFEIASNYVELEDYELKKILDSQSAIDKGLLLKTFLCVKSYFNMSEISTKLAYPSIKTLRHNIGVSSNDTVDNIIDALVDLKLIYTKNVGSYKKGDNVRNAPTCYALEKKALDRAEEFIKAELGINELYPVVIDNLSFVVHKKPKSKPKNKISVASDDCDTWGEEDPMDKKINGISKIDVVSDKNDYAWLDDIKTPEQNFDANKWLSSEKNIFGMSDEEFMAMY